MAYQDNLHFFVLFKMMLKVYLNVYACCMCYLKFIEMKKEMIENKKK